MTSSTYVAWSLTMCSLMATQTDRARKLVLSLTGVAAAF